MTLIEIETKDKELPIKVPMFMSSRNKRVVVNSILNAYKQGRRDASERQAPKKPLNVECINGRVYFWNCPECNLQYTFAENFCSNCGQAIDWSEE